MIVVKAETNGARAISPVTSDAAEGARADGAGSRDAGSRVVEEQEERREAELCARASAKEEEHKGAKAKGSSNLRSVGCFAWLSLRYQRVLTSYHSRSPSLKPSDDRTFLFADGEPVFENGESEAAEAGPLNKSADGQLGHVTEIQEVGLGAQRDLFETVDSPRPRMRPPRIGASV